MKIIASLKIDGPERVFLGGRLKRIFRSPFEFLSSSL